jgi:hypothetical protein
VRTFFAVEVTPHTIEPIAVDVFDRIYFRIYYDAFESCSASGSGLVEEIVGGDGLLVSGLFVVVTWNVTMSLIIVLDCRLKGGFKKL